MTAAEGDQSGKSEKVRRPQRVAGKTFATQATVFTGESRQFGEVLLRLDHGTESDLTRAQQLRFIRACMKFAVLSGRIDILKTQLDAQEKIIREITDAHPTVFGIESTRLGKSVTNVPEVKISPDVVRVREAAGSAFPQFGTEQVVATIIVPEDVQPSGKIITGEKIIEFAELGLLFMGMSPDTVSTNASFKRAMHVTDREALFTAVNDGLIPEGALDIKKSKKVEVKNLSRSPKTK